MPKTKLDRFRNSKTLDEERFIIQNAMARNRVYTQADLASRIGANSSAISKGMRKGFSPQMKMRLHAVLDFSEKEMRTLFGVNL